MRSGWKNVWCATATQARRSCSGARDGRWVIVSERKTDDGGTVAVYSDVTELKQREEELSVKTNALEQLSSQLAKYLVTTGVRVDLHRSKRGDGRQSAQRN